MKILARRYGLPMLILVAAVGLALLQGKLAGHERPPGAPLPGELVPTFTATSLAGKTIDFPATYRGKLVLLDFWATWCGTCRAEVPRLIEAQERFESRGLVIVGVTLDEQSRTAPRLVRDFAQEQSMLWEQVYAGASQIALDYRVQQIPSAFLVDGDTGRLLADGDDLRGGELLDTIEEHLEDRENRP